MHRILLYFNTIRYLKLSQLYWQCVRRIYHPKVSKKINKLMINLPAKKWNGSINRMNPYYQDGKINFLNRAILCDENIWDASKKESNLWQYNLHYFNGLLSSDLMTRQKMRELLGLWIQAFPSCSPIAWDPYPISLRIANVIKYQLAYQNLSHKILESIYLQARYLYKIPEYQLLGNHLLENARALVFAGLFFMGDEPKKWLALGMKILHKEIPEQILEDGGYFELSPMYHALMQEMMLDLYHFFQAYQLQFPIAWLERLQKMRYWLKVMTHPDGEPSFFNDTAIGVAATLDELEAYATRLKLPHVANVADGLTHLKDSGYIRIQNKNAVLLLDCAKVGPDYQPAHAHADTLSFEMSVNGQRCIVNSGTNTYSCDLNRQWQRATASHSTVTINKISSSQPWGVFRVAKRAYPYNLEIQNKGGEWIVGCCHDGYRSLDATHTRVWKLTENELHISDCTDAKIPAISRFYLHPDVKIKDQLSVHSDEKVDIKESIYFPEFGKTLLSQVVVQSFVGQSDITFQW